MLDNYIFYKSVSSVCCYSDCSIMEIVYFPTAVNAILNIYWPQPAKNIRVLLPVGKFCWRHFYEKFNICSLPFFILYVPFPFNTLLPPRAITYECLSVAYEANNALIHPNSDINMNDLEWD